MSAFRVIVPSFFTFVLLLSVSVAGTACAGNKSKSSDDLAYQELLSVIPDTPESREYIWIDDYSLARELFVYPQLPGPGDDDSVAESFYEWVHPIDYKMNINAPPVINFGNTSFTGPFNRRGLTPKERSRYLGFDIRNLEQSAYVAPRDARIDISLGDFDPQTIGNVLESCPECAPESRSKYKGIVYYSWSEEEDRSMKFAPPVYDHFGRGGHVAVTDDYVVRTIADDNMNLVIETAAGEHRSLADREDFQLLTNGMARMRSYTMLLSDHTYSMDRFRRSSSDMEVAIWSKPVPLRPYDAYGVGAGIDDDGPYAVLVLVHRKGRDADKNVELLRGRINKSIQILYNEPWSDSIDEAAIYADGRLLLAKMWGRVARAPGSMTINGNLLLHE